MNAEKKTCKQCVSQYEEAIQNVFAKLGVVLANHPVKCIIYCAIINLLFTIGFINLKFQNDVEMLYTPEKSKSLHDRAYIEDLFTDPTGQNFLPYQLTRVGLYGEILIMSKNKSSIMEQKYLDEINQIDEFIRSSIVVQGSNSSSYKYTDLCAVGPHGCGMVGDIILSPFFQSDFITRNVSYPYYRNISISSMFANVVSQNGTLRFTNGLRLRYYLRRNTTNSETLSKLWERRFVDELRDLKTNYTSLAFSYSDSLSSELDSITESATVFFSLTLILMMVYASISAAPFNCNNVANRMNLGFAGILAALLAITASFGLVSGTGFEVTTVVGVVPFLVIGIGIDDMFILLSGMAEAPPLTTATVEERMVYMLKKSGIAITITSITDILAFMIGASSVFMSIRIFCIYTGVAVFFCFIDQLFFLCPAIAINEIRTEKNRHFCFCSIEVQPKDEYEKESKSECYIQCFAGHRPQQKDDVESPMEKYPKRLMYLILHYRIGKTFVLMIYLVYLICSIYGTIHLGQGLLMYKLVPEDSYYRKYSIWDENYFKREPIVTICIPENQQYHLQATQTRIQSLLQTIKQEVYFDNNFEINWLDSYIRKSDFHNSSSEEAFNNGLNKFLQSGSGNSFQNDIAFHKNKSFIRSSKMYVKSLSLTTSEEKGDFLLRIRQIEKAATFPVLIFSPLFVLYEQYIQILPTTLQTVGIALTVILFVKFFFIPNLLLVGVVALTLLSILVGIFGFMHFWDLTLNSMTMIHLVMSVGFSVDFSVHICHAFVTIDILDRDLVLQKALDTTGGPIFNAAFSSLLGICILALSENYIFLSFGKVMFLVIGLGLLHACLFLPLLLYFLLPCFSKNINCIEPEENMNGCKNDEQPYTICTPDMEMRLPEIASSNDGNKSDFVGKPSQDKKVCSKT
ncbi:patched domain-containing protein 3-like [Saccostrea cucullata]|uniref:patched domain-containing protein 3-like n=1 Tax=Saccostrea cuccullata TaxID=36930 RepID=UPI002ED04261